jgi:hypothetical protein
MPIHTPGRRAGSGAALRSAKKAMSGKSGKSLFASLNLTSMVDFMTVVVIFLLMQFSASGEILFMQKDIRLPDAASGGELERVPVVAISADSITMEGAIVTSLSAVARGRGHPRTPEQAGSGPQLLDGDQSGQTLRSQDHRPGRSGRRLQVHPPRDGHLYGRPVQQPDVRHPARRSGGPCGRGRVILPGLL